MNKLGLVFGAVLLGSGCATPQVSEDDLVVVDAVKEKKGRTDRRGEVGKPRCNKKEKKEGEE